MGYPILGSRGYLSGFATVAVTGDLTVAGRTTSAGFSSSVAGSSAATAYGWTSGVHASGPGTGFIHETSRMGAVYNASDKAYWGGTNHNYQATSIVGGVTVTGAYSALAGISLSVDGDATTPAINWSSDTNVGMFRDSADNIRISANGGAVHAFSAAASAALGAFTASNGATITGGRTVSAGFSSSIDGDATTPAYNWSGDTDNGMYRSGTNEVSIAAIGQTKHAFVSGGSVAVGPFIAQNPTTFNDDVTMGSGKKLILDASTSTTSCPLQFGGDPNTGLSYVAADQMSIVAAGGAPLGVQSGAANATTLNVSSNIVNQGALYMREMSAPSGLADYAIIYAVVDGGSKTDLTSIFQTGAAQPITQEP